MLERVHELKERRDREREEMKRLIQERRKSIPQQQSPSEPTTDIETTPLETHQPVRVDPPQATGMEDEACLESSSAISLHDVDDDTLQLFYFYYDKLKRSINDSSGGHTRVPTKAELMEFVMHGGNG